jgi:drug/metabolite transporter (DMT)-like permease
MDYWLITISIAVCLFVVGQIFLKFSKNKSLLLTSYFSIIIGVLGLTMLIYLKYYGNNHNITHTNVDYLGLIAGFFFFFGQLLWITSIQHAPSIEHVRIVMAGLETVLLFIAGIYIFNSNIHNLTTIVGILLILAGVYLVNQ